MVCGPAPGGCPAAQERARRAVRTSAVTTVARRPGPRARRWMAHLERRDGEAPQAGGTDLTGCPPTAPISAAGRTPALVMAASCAIAMLGFGARSVFGLFLRADDNGARVGTGDLRAGARDPEPRVGHRPSVRRRAQRPVRLAAGACAGGAGLRCGHLRDDDGRERGRAAPDSRLSWWASGWRSRRFRSRSPPWPRSSAPSGAPWRWVSGRRPDPPGRWSSRRWVRRSYLATGGRPHSYFWPGSAFLIAPLAFLLPGSPEVPSEAAGSDQSLGAALREAFSHRGYGLVTTGFFVCGFHVAFITVHFPAYVSDVGLLRLGRGRSDRGHRPVQHSRLARLRGRWSALEQEVRPEHDLRGARGGHHRVDAPAEDRRRHLPVRSSHGRALGCRRCRSPRGSWARSSGCAIWPRCSASVFLSHQLGSFLGVWLGGWLFDTTGSYDGVWWAGAALGVAAAVIHLPIDERPVARRASVAPAGSGAY